MKNTHFIPAKSKADNVIRFGNIIEFLSPLQAIEIVAPFLEDIKEFQNT